MMLSRGNAVASLQRAAEAERLGLDNVKSDAQLERERAHAEGLSRRKQWRARDGATRAKPEGLLKQYVLLGDALHERVVHSERFGSAILWFIVVACLMVGAQTYPAVDASPVTQAVEGALLWVFVLEIVLKVVAQTLKPWRFLTGPDRAWNSFDLTIVVTCLPVFNFGSSGAALRLLRLMRLARLVRKVPKLRVLVQGMLGGLRTVTYISLLILLLTYLFAITGVVFFRENDPMHFAGVTTAMTTLFRCATLEDWTDVMYINMYGCDGQLPDSVRSPYVFDAAAAKVYYGGGTNLCSAPAAQTAFAAIFFSFYVMVAAMVMLSMFVGAITLAMAQSIKLVNQETKEAKLGKKLQKGTTRLANANSKESNRLSLEEREASWRGTYLDASARLGVAARNRRARVGALLLQAWDGQEHEPQLVLEPTPLRRGYSMLAASCHEFVTHRFFSGFIMLLIVVTGALVGLQTDERLLVRADYPGFNAFVDGWDVLLQVAFTAECVLKVVALEFEPLAYFRNPWNKFDFVIVVGSFLPSGGSLLMLLRLLRLLLVLKMIKSVPELRVAVVSLIHGASSIGYIGVMLLVVFYFFSIFGIVLFRENDPRHFANLHVAYLTLFRCATLEDWTDVMYINVYGCDKYGYLDDRAMASLCVSPRAHGGIAVVYFLVVTVVCALVMLNLFIGVISTSMEEATQEINTEERIGARVRELRVGKGISEKTVGLYKEVFVFLDLDGSGSITQIELHEGLHAAGLPASTDVVRNTMRAMDGDGEGDGEIHLAEFIEFMILVSASDEGRSASLKTADQHLTLEGPSRLLRSLRGRVTSTRDLCPYMGFVAQQLAGEMKVAAGTSGKAAYEGQQVVGSQRNLGMSAAERNTQMLVVAGTLEAFLQDHKASRFHRAGMRYLRRLKEEKQGHFDAANPSRLGMHDLAAPKPPADTADQQIYQVFRDPMDQLPKVMV